MADSDGVIVSTIDNPNGSVEPPKEVIPPLIEKDPEPAPEKTFTQSQLEKQLGQRLARERARAASELQAEREQRIRLEERLAAGAAPKEGQPDANAEPQLKDYSDFGKYTAAMARYVTKQELQTTLTERESTAKVEREQSAARESNESWNTRIAAALKDMPDYNEVLADASDLPMSKHVEAAIKESEEGPRLAYYLAQHPEDAHRIHKMTPSGAVRALTLIEVGFKPKPVTATPAPITPVGSKQTQGVKSLTTHMSQGEFEKRREAYIRSQSRR